MTLPKFDVFECLVLDDSGNLVYLTKMVKDETDARYSCAEHGKVLRCMLKFKGPDEKAD